MLADRVQKIGFSPTLAVSDLATRMRAEGIDVLDFSAGQPDFPTFENIKDAARKAIDDNQTRYTATAGLPQLREAVVARIQRDLDIVYEPKHVVVSPGAKASLYFAFMALLSKGDEVLVPSPYWTSYPEQIRMADGEPAFIECTEKNEFKLTAEQLEAAITPRSKVLLLNYPSNPTGACYSREQLESLAKVCVKHNLWIMADEIYCKLMYDGHRFVSIAQLGADVKDRTILIDGVSKSHAMTGWRIGYAAGPADVISAMGKIQSHSTSNCTSIAQWAAIEALRMTDEDLESRRAEFEKRRNAMLKRLRAIEGVTVPTPEGAFYAFPNFSAYFGRKAGSETINDGSDLATYLLESAKVAVVTGAAFGTPDYLRLSYACSLEQVEEGMNRIEKALARMSA